MAQQKQQWSEMSGGERRNVLIGAGILLVVIVLVFTMCSGPTSEDDDRGSGTMAEVMCEEFVKEKLKAPATAEFSEQKHRASGDDWVVAGLVDSENSFGAKIRGSYTCTLRETSDGEWTASNVLVE